MAQMTEVTPEELQATINALWEAQGKNGMTPAVGSIPELLIQKGIVPNAERAGYVVRVLIDMGYVKRERYSRKVSFEPPRVIDRLLADEYKAFLQQVTVRRNQLLEQDPAKE